jgi:flagellar biosynthesis/type III secretory pathway protein FliH
MSAEFGPLRVRRYRVPGLSSEPPQTAVPESPPQAGLPEGEDAASAVAADAHSSVLAISAAQPAVNEVPDRGETRAAYETHSYDEERFEAAVREEAIRFASIAAARALRVALVDEATLDKYVDDALRACGRGGRATVRLHPRDALVYRPCRGLEVVSDDSCEAGQVLIELPTGSLGATVDERAALLVGAAAC